MPRAREWTAATPPSLEEIEAIADTAYRSIPEVLRARVDAVVIRVEECPDDETLTEMECETRFDLLGLYRGLSIDRKSTFDVAEDVDMIFLYRRPLLDYWVESGEELGRLVRHVLIHEIGHHFGYSDDDMEAIDSQ